MRDLMGLMKKAQEMQARMAEIQTELETTIVEGAAGSAGHGVLVVIVTVSGSFTSTVSMLENTKMNSSGLRAGYWPRKASRLFLTTSAVRSVPSWNFTPSRSLMSQESKVSFGVTDSARKGTYSPSSFGAVRVS